MCIQVNHNHITLRGGTTCTNAQVPHLYLHYLAFVEHTQQKGLVKTDIVKGARELTLKKGLGHPDIDLSNKKLDGLVEMVGSHTAVSAAEMIIGVNCVCGN